MLARMEASSIFHREERDVLGYHSLVSGPQGGQLEVQRKDTCKDKHHTTHSFVARQKDTPTFAY